MEIPGLGIRMMSHGAEFIKNEILPVQADSLVSKEGRPLGLCLDRDCQQQEKRGEED